MSDLEKNEQEIERTVFKHKDSKIGPAIGSVIIIILILIGGLYFLSEQIKEKKNRIEKNIKIQEEQLRLESEQQKELEIIKESTSSESIDTESKPELI